MSHVTCHMSQCTTLLPTRYVSDSYTILIAVFALLRLPLSGIHHQMHVHRHAHFELQSQRRLGIVARRLGEKRVDAIREQDNTIFPKPPKLSSKEFGNIRKYLYLCTLLNKN